MQAGDGADRGFVPDGLRDVLLYAKARSRHLDVREEIDLLGLRKEVDRVGAR